MGSGVGGLTTAPHFAEGDPSDGRRIAFVKAMLLCA